MDINNYIEAVIEPVNNNIEDAKMVELNLTHKQFTRSLSVGDVITPKAATKAVNHTEMMVDTKESLAEYRKRMGNQVSKFRKSIA